MDKDKFRKFERPLANAFLAILAVSGFFLTAEFIARKILPPFQPVAYDHEKVPAPYSMFVARPYSRKDINSLGYRGKLPPETKKQNEFRVFMVGGSTMFNGDPTIAIILENILKLNFPNKDFGVYNFSVPSSKSGDELARIVHSISDYKPDLIVSYSGANDLNDPRGDPRPGYPFNFVVYEKNPLLVQGMENYPALSLFAYGSLILRKLFKPWFERSFLNLDEFRKEHQFSQDHWMLKSIQHYEKNVLKAHKFSEAIGAKYALFFQPQLPYKDVQSAEELQLRLGHGDLNFARREVRKRFGLAKEKSGLLFFDISDIFDAESRQVFTDLVHTKQFAKAIVARRMMDHLEPYIR